jgi:IgGFc binding protein
MMNTHYLLGLVVTALMYLFPIIAYSQPISPKEIRDSRGKEFWIAFPANEHGTNALQTDSLYFFVATERPTRITIFNLRERTSREIVIRNTEELITIGYSFAGNETSTNEIPGKEVFRITSDEEISVYAMNFADRSTDAFLAFPKEVLGTDYRIFSCQNNAPRPSQFILVSPENDTEVIITPSAPTRRNGFVQQRVLLQQGETYLVQASLRDTFDLTGTRVQSNKPIAVYAGHQRAFLPFAVAMPTDVPRTQDYLMEQMLPTSVWRNTCFIVPLAQAGPFISFRLPRPDSNRTDFVRIMAAQDSTIIAINAAPNATLQNTTLPTVTLNAGRFYEMLVGQPAVVKANKPISAMMYRKSGNGGINGDPFMAALPPVEQYLNRYRYLNVQGRQLYPPFRLLEAFLEHIVSVIIPTIKLPSLTINGNRVDPILFRPIAETGYSYGLIPSEATVYSITADTTFGLTVYGYGIANSYGYIGGMRFETDTLSPRIITNPQCFGLQGGIFDNNSQDSKIFWYEFPDSSQKNINLQIDPLPRPADSLVFKAALRNIYEDGEFVLNTTDSLDLLTRRRLFIPGFTVHINPSLRRNEVVQLSANAIALAAGLERCFDLTLTNYGSTTQTISSIDFTGKNGQQQPEFYSTSALPITLPPRSQRRINMCFRSDSDGFFRDTLRVGNDCIKRAIAVIEVESGFDRTAPSVLRQMDSCGRVATYRFSDSHRYASGVANLSLQNNQLQNVTIATTRNADGSISAVATLINARRDGVVQFIVQDSVGNNRTVTDTLQGFPLRIVFSPPSLSAQANRLANVDFAIAGAGITTCQTVQVWNDGLLPLVLSSPFLQSNIIFSIPQSQFPFVIAPGIPRNLTLCFSPELIRSYQDTLSIKRLCDTETISLVGEGGVRVFEGNSRCSVGVRIIPRTGSIGLAQQSSSIMRVSHRPDPARDEVTLLAVRR